jgi:hypothetical protein
VRDSPRLLQYARLGIAVEPRRAQATRAPFLFRTSVSSQLSGASVPDADTNVQVSHAEKRFVAKWARELKLSEALIVNSMDFISSFDPPFAVFPTRDEEVTASPPSLAPNDDPHFERLLRDFDKRQTERRLVLFVHLKHAVGLIESEEDGLAKATGVRHVTPIARRVKAPERARSTLERRQKERLKLQGLKEYVRSSRSAWYQETRN